MNINFPGPTSSSSNVGDQKSVQNVKNNSTQAAGNTGGLQATPSAEVSLSSTGIQALKAQLTNLPSIRQGRVQALQTAVENGTYKPSSQQIAEAIHSDLFGAPSNSGA